MDTSRPSSSSSMPSDTFPVTHCPIPRPQRPASPGVASRLFLSMRKPFTQNSPSSQRRKQSECPHGGMYSTPEEWHPYAPPRVARSRYTDASSERPTIEQIAMGLHISRTPHLRSRNPVQRHSPMTPPSLRRIVNIPPNTAHIPLPHGTHDPQPTQQARKQHSLPPPPPRSSMKKTSVSTSTLTPRQQPSPLFSASPSISTVTSAGPLTPDSWSVWSFKRRMSKFIPGYRPPSMAASIDRSSTFTSSGSDATRPATPRKAVRFSTSVLALDQLSS